MANRMVSKASLTRRSLSRPSLVRPTLALAIAALALSALLASAALADRIKLKDGRVIEGTVIAQGAGFWVKGTDGQTYKFDGPEVLSVDRGTPATPAPGAAPGAAAPGA